MEDKKEKSPKSEKKQNSRKAGLWTRLLLRIVTIIVIALIVLCGGYIGFKRFTTVKTESKLALVDRQLSY